MPANVRHFLAFRLLFNARFYYPVLAVLFVDLGLTLDQYAILNVAWAVSIVCFELPLGAVADKLGRRPLIVGAAALMVVEMAVLAFAPTGNPTLLFWVFLVNRVLSGLAEAAASGADEALAYDTLVEEGRRDEWPVVLSRLQYLMSAGFIVSSVLGALVYDNGLVNRLLGTSFTQAETARFPVYLTLLLSFGAFAVSLRMREPSPESEGPAPATGWAGVMEAAKWILATRFALLVIIFVLLLDSAMRMFMTMIAGYYRLIGIPESMFGVFFAVFASMGFVVPRVARRLVESRNGLAELRADDGDRDRQPGRRGAHAALGRRGLRPPDVDRDGAARVLLLALPQRRHGFRPSRDRAQLPEPRRQHDVRARRLALRAAVRAPGGWCAAPQRLAARRWRSSATR